MRAYYGTIDDDKKRRCKEQIRNIYHNRILKQFEENQNKKITLYSINYLTFLNNNYSHILLCANIFEEALQIYAEKK